MLVYRICLERYSYVLRASGVAARWNDNGLRIVYAAENKSLACLENLVHRKGVERLLRFSLLSIEIPDELEVKTVNLNDLPLGWNEFSEFSYMKCRKFLKDNINFYETPLIRVPSALIAGEYNFLMFENHPFFRRIRIVDRSPFAFDKRL